MSKEKEPKQETSLGMIDEWKKEVNACGNLKIREVIDGEDEGLYRTEIYIDRINEFIEALTSNLAAYFKNEKLKLEKEITNWGLIEINKYTGKDLKKAKLTQLEKTEKDFLGGNLS